MSEKVNVKIENLPGSEVKVSITVPSAELEKFIDQAAQDLSKTIKVDGFRQGKIPKEVVERTVGKETLLHEGAEKAIRKTYVDAILDHKIEAIGQPKVQIKKIAQGNDLEFEAVIAIMPQVEVKDYEESIKKINQEYKEKKVEIKEEEIERELKYLANQRAKIVTVDRQAQLGDQVEVDFQVLKDGVPIEGGTAKKHLLVLGEGKFIPGFEDNLLGAQAGQEKKFELSFPKKYHAPHLAGQKAVFEIKVNLVQERQIPEINDEFASGIGKFKDLAGLKKNISEGIEHEEKHKLADEQKRKQIDVLLSKVKTDLPKVLVEVELERMLQELDHSVAMMGLDRQKYLEQVKTTEEKLKEQWRAKEAQDRVKVALAIRKIAQDQKIEPVSQEIEERMNKHLHYYKTMGDVEKNLDMERLYEAVKGELTNEKVFEYLLKL